MPGCALFLVLEDDRLARRYDELNETLMDELTYVASLSSFTWSRLSALLQDSMRPQLLKSTALHAAQVACAYIREKDVAAQGFISLFLY